ncbi:hypothetical protein CCP1ISM_160021 [Azospirillaceae bacterium]
MSHEDKLNLAIKKVQSEMLDIKKHADEEYEKLKSESNELFKLVEDKLCHECKKLVKLQVNFGDCKPNRSVAYIIFDIGLITKVELKLDDDRTYNLLAYYINKINSRHQSALSTI